MTKERLESSQVHSDNQARTLHFRSRSSFLYFRPGLPLSGLSLVRCRSASPRCRRRRPATWEWTNPFPAGGSCGCGWAKGSELPHHGGAAVSGKHRRVCHGPEQDREELGPGEADTRGPGPARAWGVSTGCLWLRGTGRVGTGHRDAAVGETVSTAEPLAGSEVRGPRAGEWALGAEPGKLAGLVRPPPRCPVGCWIPPAPSVRCRKHDLFLGYWLLVVYPPESVFSSGIFKYWKQQDPPLWAGVKIKKD